MWDVKLGIITRLNDATASFISTMWDVKEIKFIVHEFEYEGFYLDYVGCKDLITLLSKVND